MLALVNGNSTVDRSGVKIVMVMDIPTRVTISRVKSQYVDSDLDGYGDNSSGFQADDCPAIFGESNKNGTYGCIDTDSDGWAI